MKNKLLPELLAIALAGGLCGCAAFNSVRTENPATLGRELLDLKAARDAGAISADKYDELRDQIIEGRLGSKDGEEDDKPCCNEDKPGGDEDKPCCDEDKDKEDKPGGDEEKPGGDEEKPSGDGDK